MVNGSLNGEWHGRLCSGVRSLSPVADSCGNSPHSYAAVMRRGAKARHLSRDRSVPYALTGTKLLWVRWAYKNRLQSSSFRPVMDVNSLYG